MTLNFPAAQPTHDDVWEWYQLSQESLFANEAAIKRSVSDGAQPSGYWYGMTLSEITDRFRGLHDELDVAAMMLMLSACEAELRLDYQRRTVNKRKDPLSRRFRTIHKVVKQKPRLDEDILAAWREEHTRYKGRISDFRGTLKLRHWIAHGRYWVPKFGLQYQPELVFAIVDQIVEMVESA
jgi:hypothetical protein